MTNLSMVEDQLVYAAICSNRNENNISTCGELLLYSRYRSPIVYNLRTKSTEYILHGHSEEVNGQCFIGLTNNSLSPCFLISTAHDKSAIIWHLNEGNYKILFQIKSQDDSVFTTRGSFLGKSNKFCTLLTTLNGNIYIYENDQLIDSVQTRNCYFDSKFYQINYAERDSNLLLVAIAGSDYKLHIFNLTNDLKLHHLLDLSGFSDWIKCVDIYPLPGSHETKFILATACQDSLIQVWLMKLISSDINYETQVRANISEPLPHKPNLKLTGTLETVLSGHEGFVHGLCWFKKTSIDPTRLQLVSCSSDRTLVIWRSSLAKQNSEDKLIRNTRYEQHSASEGVWQELIRLGETGEANLPFIGVCLSEDESTIYAQSLRGAIHSWTLNVDSDHPDVWIPSEAIGGHYGQVTDLSWERTGSYLLSSSLDKTCRLHAISARDKKWHELARPQVHGYEINCLASLNFFKFASGAEEKNIRTFEVTKFFIKNYKALAELQLPAYCKSDIDNLYEELPDHAQLPALGLSNRGSQKPFDVNEDEVETLKPSQQSGDQKVTQILSDNNSWHEVSDLVHYLSRIDHLSDLPTEDILLQSTLWWEKNKLFGHSNEMHALASDSKGSFLASASKANRSDLASVIIWDTEKFRKVATIEHHTLTITRLQFSPNDKYLLSVSRDRTWCISERNATGQLRNAYVKLVATVKSNSSHERIIWDCCWTHDSKYFLTVSRDKKAILWSIESLRLQLYQLQSPDPEGLQQYPSVFQPVCMNVFKDSIQAVDCAQLIAGDGSYLFILGFEDGSIELHSISVTDSGRWHLLKSIQNFHQTSIRRLAVQPVQENGGIVPVEKPCSILLASGADDCMVKLTRFHFR